MSRYTSYLPLLIPPVLVASYVLASLPIVSNRLPSPTFPGLASLPANSPARVVYPEDWTEGGAYVQLPMGQVRYWLVGPESGKKIVLIHGLSTPALAYAALVPILVGAGYRVLLYDLYGRGYSDAPRDVPYDAKLYVTQLALLLQHVKWERTRLVGFSMGGPIAAAFVATFPALVERDVVLIASAGVSNIPIPLTRFRHLPFVERLVMRKLLSRTHSTKNPGKEILHLQAASLPGYARALVSSLHDGPVTRMRWAFEAKSWAGRRVLLVHGAHDAVVPYGSSPILKSFLESVAADPNDEGSSSPHVEMTQIPGAGHDLMYTHAEEVGRALLVFLGGSGA